MGLSDGNPSYGSVTCYITSQLRPGRPLTGLPSVGVYTCMYVHMYIHECICMRVCGWDWVSYMDNEGLQRWKMVGKKIHDWVPAPSDGGARSSAGECAAAVAIKLLTPQSIMGLLLVSAAGAAAQSAVNKATAGAAPGGRNAELQSKGRHSDNAFHNTRAHTFCLIHIHRTHTFSLKHTHTNTNTRTFWYILVCNTHTYANARTLVLSYTNLYLKYTPLFSK